MDTTTDHFTPLALRVRGKNYKTKEITRRKEKVVRNRRPRDTVPGYSQKLKRGNENELERELRLEKVVTNKHLGWPCRRKKKR